MPPTIYAFGPLTQHLIRHARHCRLKHIANYITNFQAQNTIKCVDSTEFLTVDSVESPVPGPSAVGITQVSNHPRTY